MDDTLKPLRAGIEPYVSIEVRQSSRVPNVVGDAAKLQQMMVELWNKARQAIGDKPGLITIMTHTMRLDAAALRTLRFADRAEPGDFVVFEIDDTGAGMDVETLAETVSPLPYGAKGPSEGNLADVAEIIRAHSGALYVESEPGHGMTFQVFLPAAPAALSKRPASDQNSGKPTANTILIADDDDAIRALSKWVVERAGFRTLTARNGQEALAHYRADPDVVRLVLLDLSMPRMTGEEVIAGLRQIRPEVAIVLITGHGQDAILKSEREGAVAILQKPFAPDDLRALLKKLAP